MRYSVKTSVSVRHVGDSRLSTETHDGPLVPTAPGVPTAHDPYAALRFRDYRLYLASRFLGTLAEQMLAVAVGWELYLRTRSAFALGLVGLAQVLPVIVLSLPAGHLADRRDRRRIVIATEASYALCSLGLLALSATNGPVPLFYLFIFLFGVAQAFNNPAGGSIVPLMVPAEHFENAATWNSSSWQLAAVIGPALGGVLIAVAGRSTPVYAFDAAAGLAVVVLLALIRAKQPPREATEATTLESLREGLGFLWRTQLILATITLDLFAVLLGGAVTLLPIYATAILRVGAVGLGAMRAAPSVGAVAMAITRAHLPPFRRAGRTLLLAVAGFGLATIVFGLSRNVLLSVAMLAALGALDNISVVVRATLMLTRTPDGLRGRVSAVNGIFVGASNELGGFESGTLAAAIGPVGSVVIGGIGTLVVVGLVALIWPELRRLRGLMDGV